MNGQMALLNGVKGSLTDITEASSGSVIPVTCKGRAGELTITANTGALFNIPEGKQAARTSLLDCCSNGAVSFEIKQEDLIGGTIVSGTTIQIWYCKHATQSPDRPIRRLLKSAKLVCVTEGAAQHAVRLLREAAAPRKKDTQRRLLIIVNPCSGRGKARHTFTKHVRPILEAAGFHLDVRETQGPGHATDIVKEAELQIFDAVVAVGGDGTIFEILQGYFHGEDWAQRVRAPFCLVPSGSGNALAANCGLWTPETAAIAICKGRTRALDIFSVVQPPSRRYFAFLSIYYGMMANLDHGTDHLRWMGSMRFTLGAIHEVLRHRRYAATVAYMPAAKSTQDSAKMESPTQEHVKHPSPVPSTQHSSSNAEAHSTQLPPEDNVLHSSSNAEARRTQQATEGNGHSSGATPGSCSSAGPSLQLLQALGPEDQLQLSHIAEMHPGWQLLSPRDTSFFAAVNLPMLDFHSSTGPQADFNSGCLDIIYVPNITNRKQGLEWLDQLGKGRHMDGNLTHLKKACAMIIEPYSEGTSLVVDGEAIPYKRVYLEVHPSLCSVIVA
ncbi:g4421 [Coccomyxa viridis]|uniref:G4421 protein n=1 Tax=Coccomyxa viridis TaxID=1274662 RepID=A0ABP1FTD4_9CHLO